MKTFENVLLSMHVCEMLLLIHILTQMKCLSFKKPFIENWSLQHCAKIYNAIQLYCLLWWKFVFDHSLTVKHEKLRQLPTSEGLPYKDMYTACAVEFVH